MWEALWCAEALCTSASQHENTSHVQSSVMFERGTLKEVMRCGLFKCECFNVSRENSQHGVMRAEVCRYLAACGKLDICVWLCACLMLPSRCCAVQKGCCVSVTIWGPIRLCIVWNKLKEENGYFSRGRFTLNAQNLYPALIVLGLFAEVSDTHLIQVAHR